MAIMNCTPTQAQACRDQYGDAHDMQLEVQGECGWCGAYKSDDEPLGWVDEITGNVYGPHGELLEQHDFSTD
jgi:hypothetical protein